MMVKPSQRIIINTKTIQPVYFFGSFDMLFLSWIKLIVSLRSLVYYYITSDKW